MNLSAYQINAELEKLACAEILADGRYMVGEEEEGNVEVFTEEEYHKKWEEMQLNKEEKLNNVAELDNALDDDIASLDAKIARLEKLKKQKKNVKIRLRERVVPWLLNGEKYTTQDGHSFSYRRGQEVIINDVHDTKNIPAEIAAKLPQECVKVTYSARLTEIKKAVADGVDLSDILKVVGKITTIIK